ncbi:uncharacterized protein [Temnothorax nylanderi]|uniref:uncharacterized protein n=1 Tax=Temnothorax nylanderi TaxID=102681 RepID=UPI003A878EB9
MFVLLSRPSDIRDFCVEQLQFVPKAVLLQMCGDHVHYVWDKLPEHIKTDLEVQTYRRTLQSTVATKIKTVLRKNVMSADTSRFDDCNLTNVKLYLNSEVYPYDDLNLDFGKHRLAILYDIISGDRRAVRILGRRYALTATGYKFLEIGINVGPPSYVEIAVGDHRGKELILSLETWKALYEQRRNIQNFLRNDYKDIHSFINIGPLTVRVCTSVNNVKLIRLESVNVRLMMTESTLRRMFDLDRCIDARFDRLIRILAAVDAKFAQFSDIASTVTDPKEVSNVIYASDAFNTNQLIDCELAALVF